MRKKVEETITGSSIVLNGVMYELTTEPTHGTIRAVKKMQKDLSVSLIRKHREKFDGKMKVEDALQQIFEEDPVEFSDYTDATEEFEILATLSLATNKLWTSDGIANVTQRELDEAFERCKELLGGSVYSFL